MSQLHDLLDETLDRLEALYERGEAITGTPTGYTDLDELTAGLQPDALIVVGARPGHGQDLVRPRHGRPRRARGPPAGAVLLASR